MGELVSTPKGMVIGRAKVPPHLKASLRAEEKTALDAVAVLGSVGDWAAYAGHHTSPDEMIHQHGIKLHADEAAPLFPYLVIERYRR